jgi:glycosyltransferase involved in cell wall biosynthesis
VHHEVALGGNVARNSGIKVAEGEFIAGLDDDDEFTSDRIECLMKNQSENYSLITSDDLMVCGEKIINKTNKPKIITLKHMLKENVVGNQVLIRKDRLLALNCFDEKLTASQDYDMWIRVIQQYGDAYVVKKGLQKIHVSNEINRISSVGAKKFSGYFCFYKKHKKLFSKNDRKQQLARLYKTRNKKMTCQTLFTLFSIYSIKQYVKTFRN